MTKTEAIGWFKREFGVRIAESVAGTPFSGDLIAAIAYQETGYIWSGLVQKGFASAEVLRLCVGDTLDRDGGRSCFPKTRTELLATPRGAEMFAIARQALLEMAEHTRGYENATINPNKFCHGFGIFQYDIQFFRENPDFFLQRRWAEFEACLAQFIGELKQALTRQGWAKKAQLSDAEQVYLAIAYNQGSADCHQGFKQGHESEGRCYGENIEEFLGLARGIADGGEQENVVTPALASPVATETPLSFTKRGAIFEVVVEQGPLRLRSAPTIPADDPAGNVIARLPAGHLVQRVSSRQQGEFIEVETTLEGAPLRGFASAKFLRRVQRATAVKKTRLKATSLSSSEATSHPVAQKTSEAITPASQEQGEEIETMDIEEIIKAVQKAIGVDADGRAGPDTWKAIYARVMGKAPAAGSSATLAPVRLPAAATASVDARSEKNIATLQPEVRPYARALVLKAASMGITIKVISGLRTYDEQNDLYAQGRSKPGKIVTNARGGYSNHNFGVAFDIGVFNGASYVPESPRYKAVGALGVELGLEWGGNWKTIKDEPHFQLRPLWAGDESEAAMLAELRARKDSGEGYYA